ncbi:MAG: hypothetical protein JOZ62_14475, partial [Acidobacteriaceae bacterium]|nr:hypothetical protein [Acidobacteriaceae bacterium]
MRPFLIAVVCSWIALFATALFYSNQYPNFGWIWTAALPAFLLETLFYLGSVFENTRAMVARIHPSRILAVLLWTSAVVPYLVFSVSAGAFQHNAFYTLALVTAVLAFWYVVLPRRVIFDIGFLIVAATPLIARVFQRVY